MAKLSSGIGSLPKLPEILIEVYIDDAREWRWRFKASNGQVLATSSEGYKRAIDLRAALKYVKYMMPLATVKMVPPPAKKASRKKAKKK